jgi:hypothetical protein
VNLSHRDVIQADPAYAPLFREIGLDAAGVFDDPRIVVWRSLPDRQNAMLDHVQADGSVVRLHIKRYPPHAAAMATLELNGFKLLCENQIPCAPIIARGSRADAGSFIILPDLAGYTPADKLLAGGFDFDRLLDITADVAALLHNHRLHHRDLYLCHFMVRPEPLDARLIDMARVAKLANPLTRRRWIVKDLAQFWYSTQSLPVTDAQRDAWLRRYCQRRKIDPMQLIGAVRRKAAEIARHDVKLKKQQPLRNVSISPLAPGSAGVDPAKGRG